MCEHDNEIGEIAKTVDRIDKKTEELYKLLIGNGEPTRGLVYRVALLEQRFGNVPTWQWVLERAALPVIMLGAGALIAYLLN